MEFSKPFLVVFLIQILYAGMFLLSKAAFNVGMNNFIFTFYRQAIATIFVAPVAIFLERLEIWKIKTAPGIAKLIGIVVCLGGALTLALYKGPSIKLFSHPHLHVGHPTVSQQPQTHAHSGPTWIKGVFILLTGNTFWALWLVMQARIMKGYPSKLLFTALSCFLSSLQSFAIAILVERRPSEWRLGWNVRLLAVAYCGIVVTGVAYYLQTYVIEKKGPVFLALWTPLGLILTMSCSVLLLGEIITLGSILGGILLVGGLYSFLWAKSKEQMIIPFNCSPVEVHKECLDFKIVEATKTSPSIV